MEAIISPAESEQLETLTLGRRIAQLHLKFGLPGENATVYNVLD